MRVHGVVITAAQQQAILARMTDGFGLCGLTEVAVKAGVPRTAGYNAVAMRTVDRLIQLGRKAGMIEQRAGIWRLSAPGIPIAQEPKDLTQAMGSMVERCCFCDQPTAFWHLPKDVAVCKTCAASHAVAQVPDKEIWFAWNKQKDAARR